MANDEHEPMFDDKDVADAPHDLFNGAFFESPQEPDTSEPILSQGQPIAQCRSCGAPLVEDYGDALCRMCFVANGIDVVVETLSNQVQQSLFENLLHISRRAHQREQTDTAYYALLGAYHAAYHPSQIQMIIDEAQSRADSWAIVLDECGEVRASDYLRTVDEARMLQHDMLEVAE